MGVDLHCHSTCSDGTVPPGELAALATGAGLDGFALTDHDTFEGLGSAAAAARDRDLAFVPGIELSTEHRDSSVHVLGYWPDPGDEALAQECRRLRGERERRARVMLERLEQLGVGVDAQAVRDAAGEAPIGRPHLATALVRAGHVADIDEAFTRYLAEDAPAYEPKHALPPEEGVALIVAAGGAAVLAHPGLEHRGHAVDEALLDRMVDRGLAGVEAEHAGHDRDTREHWGAAARRRGLLVTGSSDFHGDRKDTKMGAASTTTQVVRALAERRTKEGAPW